MTHSVAPRYHILTSRTTAWNLFALTEINFSHFSFLGKSHIKLTVVLDFSLRFKEGLRELLRFAY